MAQPTTRAIASVSDFITRIASTEKSASDIHVFRGQSDESWELTPSILRPHYTRLLAAENLVIRDMISVHPNEFLNDETMFDRLVRAQHYGLPTRLLDVTGNPLVALYFASDPDGGEADGKIYSIYVNQHRQKYYDSDAVSCISNLANLSADEKIGIETSKSRTLREFNALKPVDRLLQFIRVEKPYFRAKIDRYDLFRPYHVRPKQNNKRIVAQNGSFIIWGLGIGPSHARNIRGTSLIIPHRLKQKIRNELHNLGIYEATLFPEIEKAAEYLKRRYTA